MSEFINPFDFRKILLEYFLGSTELFMFAFVIAISFVCAKFQMTNKIYLTLLAISSMIFAVVLGQVTYILVIVIISFISFKGFSKLLN